MKQKIKINEHGNEWMDKVVICPECSSDKLMRTPIKWETTVCCGEGIRYRCKRCNCSFDVKKKGTIKPNVIFRIASGLTVMAGAVSFILWIPLLTGAIKHGFVPAIVFSIVFVITLILSLLFGDAA